jgi:hypothetical protein
MAPSRTTPKGLFLPVASVTILKPNTMVPLCHEQEQHYNQPLPLPPTAAYTTASVGSSCAMYCPNW